MRTEQEVETDLYEIHVSYYAIQHLTLHIRADAAETALKAVRQQVEEEEAIDNIRDFKIVSCRTFTPENHIQ